MSEKTGEPGGSNPSQSPVVGNDPDWNHWLGLVLRWLVWTVLYVGILLWLLFVYVYSPTGRIFDWHLQLLILGLSLAAGLLASLVVEVLIWLLGKISRTAFK